MTEEVPALQLQDTLGQSNVIQIEVKDDATSPTPQDEVLTRALTRAVLLAPCWLNIHRLPP